MSFLERRWSPTIASTDRRIVSIGIHRRRRHAPLERIGKIASVPREGLNRERGEGGPPPEAEAVPASVSGECDAYRSFLHWAHEGLGRPCIVCRPVSQATCRRLVALAWPRGWPWHGTPSSDDRCGGDRTGMRAGRDGVRPARMSAARGRSLPGSLDAPGLSYCRSSLLASRSRGLCCHPLSQHRSTLNPRPPPTPKTY